MFSVACSSSQLANKNAEPINGKEAVGFEEIVEFQCKEGFSGMNTNYTCSLSGLLEPVEGSASIVCNLDQGKANPLNYKLYG